MNRFFDKLFKRGVNAAYRRLPIVGADGFNVSELIQLRAAMDTADYCVEHLPRARAFGSSIELISYALECARLPGLCLEFGVATGTTINHIAAHVPGGVHGFDSFEGLPEDWRTGFAHGHFAQAIPKVRENVELHIGLFSKTLPEFINLNHDLISFLHVDCDLYSSTVDIFQHIGDKIRNGTVIVFDEYFNHPTWRRDEWLAFQEFVKRTGLNYEYIGYVPSHQQAAVLIN